MSQKYNLSANLVDEYKKYQELYLKGNGRTVSGNLSFTSFSSGFPYISSTGEEGLMALLYNALKNHLIEASDINTLHNKIDQSKKDILEDVNYNLLTVMMELYYDGYFNGVQVQGAKGLFYDVFRDTDNIDLINSSSDLVADLGKNIVYGTRNITRGIPVYVISNSHDTFTNENNATDMQSNTSAYGNFALNSNSSFAINLLSSFIAQKYLIKIKHTVSTSTNRKTVLQGSTNGSAWTTLVDFGDLQRNVTHVLEGDILVPSSYQYYRVNFTTTSGSSTRERVDLYLFELFTDVGKYKNVEFKTENKPLITTFTKSKLYLAAKENSNITTYVPYISSNGGTNWTIMTELSRRTYPRDTNYIEYEYEANNVPEGSNLKLKIELNTTDNNVRAEIKNYGLYFLA